MTRPDDVELLRQAMGALARGDAVRRDACPNDWTLAAVAEGSLDGAARAALMPHLAACARCRHLVASVTHALADRDVTRAVRATEGRGWWRIPAAGRIAVGVAAAAVLLLLAWPPPPPDMVSTHRAAPITAAPAPVAVSPIGAVADAASLRWTSVPGADRYRVTLFDAEGGVLYERELADTMAALPDSVLPAPGGTYWWTVDARLDYDRWVSSDLFEFSIVGAGRR